jgi:hypothetical protein
MKRVNTRGMDLANKHVMMAALTYNLKKYLKYCSKAVTKVVEKQTEIKTAFFDFFSAFKMIFSRFEPLFLRY